MDYFKKIERSVTISADKRSTVDLQVDVWSQDLNVTKFILKLDTTDSTTIDLTNATVRVVMVYTHDGQNVTIEAAGIVEDVATQKIAYIMNNRLAGFEGLVIAGFYVTLSTGQRIDIQNVTFNMRKSLLDKDLDVPTENYYQTFDDIVADVRQTGDTAKTQIGQVLPDVQSKVAAINTELAKIDENMPDLFVAYADDSQGSGFSKTDTTKLYKGYGVKNSNLSADYRWEKNVDRLQVGCRNLLKDTANFGTNGRPGSSKDGWLTAYDSTIESEKYNGLTVRSLKNVTSIKSICDYYFTGFNLGDTYTFSFWAKGTINTFRCYFYGDSGYVRNVDTIGSNGYKGNGGDGVCAFDNQNISANEWRRFWVTWKLATTGDINIAKRAVIRADGATGGDLYVCGVKLEKGNQATDWSPAPEDMLLNSNPINSVLTTLSAENPSTTLGGTWTQLGTETKFSNTIYYWKRTN